MLKTKDELPSETMTGLAAPPRRALSAARDLRDGMSRYWLWTSLAMEDIRLRYRGSILGPFWLTISMLIMVGAMGTVYAELFSMNVREYLPYLTIGLVLWQFLSAMIIEGCQTFLSTQSIIQQARLPYSIHVYRLVCRNVFVLAHNAVIIPLGMILFSVPATWRLLLLFPALFAMVLNGVWIGIFFGMASARFRDIPPIVANFVQVVFFITPIFWSASSLAHRAWIVEFNPLFAFVDIARAAVLGMPAAAYSWPMVILVTIVGSMGTFLFFARFRARIAFWI